MAGGETKSERLDRELIELLNELRVALPGVQILFAFLLTVPFNSRFAEVTELQRDTYFVALLCTLLSSILLIAPTAYHRIRFRDYDKERIVRTSTHLAIAGLALLALGLTASAFFVTDFLFGALVAAVVAGVAAGMLAWLWFGLPVTRKLRDR